MDRSNSDIDKARQRFKELLERQIELAKEIADNESEQILIEAISELRLIIIRKAAEIEFRDFA